MDRFTAPSLLLTLCLALLAPGLPAAAELADAPCWECHDKDPFAEGRVHPPVADGECEACHHETNARMLDIPHVEYFADFWIDCTTCHHPSSEPQRAMSCSACHHCPTHCADETLSSKVVIHASCWRCHEVGAGAAASGACATCHAGPKRAWGDGERPSWIDAGS